MSTEGNERRTSIRAVAEAAKSWAANTIGTSRTRLDVFTSDVEDRIFRFIARMVWTVIAFVSLTIGFFLAMLTVVFGFDLHPKYALGIPAAAFLLVGLVAVIKKNHARRPRPRDPGSRRAE